MGQLPTLASKVDWLFRNTKKGKEYTYQEMAKGISKYLPEGKGVGHTWVWKLRKGKLQEPGYLKLKALSLFFGVPITFFYEDDLTSEELTQLQQKTLAEKEVAIITRHARQMNSDSRQTLLQIITALEDGDKRQKKD